MGKSRCIFNKEEGSYIASRLGLSIMLLLAITLVATFVSSLVVFFFYKHLVGYPKFFISHFNEYGIKSKPYKFLGGQLEELKEVLDRGEEHMLEVGSKHEFSFMSHK